MDLQRSIKGPRNDQSDCLALRGLPIVSFRPVLHINFSKMAMSLLAWVLALVATIVQGQNTVSWTEATSGVVYSLAIPEAAAAPFNVYLSITAPINVTWAAVAFGGCMLRSPLVVAWKNDTNVVAAPRWAK